MKGGREGFRILVVTVYALCDYSYRLHVIDGTNDIVLLHGLEPTTLSSINSAPQSELLIHRMFIASVITSLIWYTMSCVTAVANCLQPTFTKYFG